MSRYKLQAEKREILGKQVKTVRTQNLIPAVLFGPKRASTSVVVNDKELSKVVAAAGFSNLIDFTVAGESKSVKVIIKEVQKHPITQKFYHVSFYEVDEHKPLTATIPVVLHGESEAVKNNIGFLSAPTQSIVIRCLPDDLPSHIDVDISILKEIGDTITIADLPLPEGVALDSSEQPTNSIASIQPPQKQIEVEETAAPAEGATPAAEGAAATPETKSE
jgi:large subunit ribosomal protein L25